WLRPHASLRLAEPGGQRGEVLARVIEAGPDGVEGDALNAGDLLAREALDLEQHERRAALFSGLSGDGEQGSLVFAALELGGGTTGAALEHVGILDAAPGEDVLDPGAAAKVAHLAAGDPVHPSSGVGPIEGAESPAHHEKDLLHDVVAIGLGA